MAAVPYRYYRFAPTAIRTPAGVTMQISEFAMLSGSTRLTGMSITATHSTTGAGEEETKAGDNNTATKWCNTAGVPCTLVYDFGAAVAADGYRWATANDASGRDPVSWTVAGSNDGSTWVTLDTQTNYATTTSRLTFLSDFPLWFATVLDGAATSLYLAVQVAWGADLTASSSTWTWTDITTDVLVDGGEQITYSLGRQDEAATSQPAACTLRLDNRSGDYSLGPQSSNWPYVKRSTPIRIRVAGDITTSTPFFGYVDSWSPDWDQSGRYAVVNVSASGALRRLQQGKALVLSPIRRAMRNLIGGNLIGYWPMEDGKNSIGCTSDIPGDYPLDVANQFVDGVPKFADASPFACSAPIVTMDYSRLDAYISNYTDTGSLQIRCLIEFPKNGMNDNTHLMAITTTNHVAGKVEEWSLYYGVGGTLLLDGTDVTGAVLANSTAIAFDVDGLRLRVGFFLTQNGANVDYEISTYAAGASAGSFFSGTFAAVTVGVAEGVFLLGNADATPVMGHLTLQNAATSIFTDRQQFNAYIGEAAITRFGRLCTENLIYGTNVSAGGTTGPLMGAQSVADLLTLLRECETADQGILYDGLDQGLSYLPHSLIVNHPTPSLILDASAGRIRHLEPVDDDQQLRNRVTVTRTGGGTITDEDATGALGTAEVGIYDDSVTINVESDLQLPDYAGWLVNLGTVEGYRYPHMELDLRDLSTALITSAFAKLPMRRIDVTNLSTVRTQLPSGTLSLVPAGWSGAFDKHRWGVVYNCGRFDGYNVVLLDESDAVHGLRPNTTGSTLASSAAAGATSLSVATPSGPLWTTDSADCPMTIEVGDLPVVVSAISGGSSPQTFTCTAIDLARASGATVTLPRSRPVLDIEDN